MNTLSVLFVLLNLGMQEILIILLIVLLLFGATRIPALMRSLGRGVGSFKKGLKEDPDTENDKNVKDDAQK